VKATLPALALLLTLLGVTHVARAQEIPWSNAGDVEHPLERGMMGEPRPESHGLVGHRLGVELGVMDARLSTGHFVFGLLGMVSARLVLAPEWQLDIALPFAFGFQSIPVVDGTGAFTGTFAGDGQIRTGNPYAAIAYAPLLPSGWRARFTAGAVAPAAQLSDQSTGLDALLAGLEANGAASRWLWMPSRLSLVASASVEHDVGRTVLGGQLAGAASFCIDTMARCGHVVDAPLEAMVFLAAKLRDDDESRIGLRLRVAALPTATTEATQFSLEPYVHVRIDNFYVDGRFVMNLDDPYGFAFDRRGVWAIFAGVGVID